MSVKPQDDWGFNFPDVPFVPEKPVSKTKQCISALEESQKEELIHREIVRRRLLNLENKKELNAMLGKFVDAMNTMHTDMQKSLRRISALEEVNRKLRAAVSNAIPPP